MECQIKAMMKQMILDLTFPQRSQLHGFVIAVVQEWTNQLVINDVIITSSYVMSL